MSLLDIVACSNASETLGQAMQHTSNSVVQHSILISCWLTYENDIDLSLMKTKRIILIITN